jgi:hypothetical protein
MPRTKFLRKNMKEVWMILDGIDGNLPVELEAGLVLPGVPTVSDVKGLPTWPVGLRLVVDRKPPLFVRVERS